MKPFRIFIVEDDPWYGELLKYHLSLNPDYDVALFTTGKDCLANLHTRPDAVCIDYSLPDMKGDDLLNRIHSVNKKIPVVVISGQDEIPVVLQLLKAGATDYIVKDENAKDLLWKALIVIRERKDLVAEVEELKEQIERKFSFEKTIIGKSSKVRDTFSLIEKAATTNINVSISGETGTGKEVYAKAIHYNSDRRKGPFVAVNMAAIPKELIESELFGFEKGAFTGAMTRRIGKFEEANKGTIFLDEIAELDASMQAKLLRVLQEREVTRIGGNENVKIDARLITATHRDIGSLVKSGEFREDLFYRIIGLPIALPPLRERGADVLILAKYFIDDYASVNKSQKLKLSEGAKTRLMKYNYPGNIRELKAIIDLACVMANGDEIVETDISFPSVTRADEFTVVEKTMQEYNWDIIRFYLGKYQNNVLLVADKLQIGKSTIYNLLKRAQPGNTDK
jgi:two-component system, NtrC family, response regulator AtoC